MRCSVALELLNYVVAYSALGIVMLSLSVFVFLRNARAPLNRIFSVYSFCIAWWSLFTIPMIINEAQAVALVWDRICLVGAIFIPSTFIHFVAVFLKKIGSWKKYVQLSYLISSLFFGLNLISCLVSEVAPVYVFRYYTIPGIYYSLFVGFFCAVSTAGTILLFSNVRRIKDPRLRKQANWLSWTSLFGYVGGTINFSLGYGIVIPGLTDIANYAVLIYGVSVAYIILKYRFLDIEVIIRRTIVFAGIAITAVCMVAIPLGIIQTILGKAIGVSPFVLMVSGIIVTAVIYRPLERWLVNLTDKYLFQKKFDYAKVLKEASKDLALVTSLNELTRKMIAVLVRKARTKSVAIFARSVNDGYFSLKGCYGYSGGPRPEMVLGAGHPLAAYLNGHQHPVTRIQLENDLMRAEGYRREEVKPVIEWMKQMKAEVAVPSFIGREGRRAEAKLQGILLLGGKKSDENYDERDLDMLATLAHEHAVKFENVRLFDVVLHERELKLEAEKKAERISYTRTLKHEAGNALVGIEDGAVNMRNQLGEKLAKLRQMLLERFTSKELRGLDQIEELIVKYANRFENAGRRVCMIVDSVVGALGGGKETKQEMTFRVPWETAKLSTNVDYDFRFIVNTPDDFRIYGNVDLIERVFENFFTNSRDAAGEVEEKLIYLNAEHRVLDGKKVAWFEYWDSGPGIPDALFKKVFEQGFSTKPKPKSVVSMETGHGQGLYVCKKNIEEFHQGKMWLDKNPATGNSMFVFWMPDKENE